RASFVTNRQMHLSFSPNGQHIVGAARIIPSPNTVHHVRIWNVKTGLEMRTLCERAGGVNAVAYSPSGHQIATDWGRSIRLRNAESGQLVLTAEHPTTVNGVGYSPNGQEIATAGEDGVVRIWPTTATGRVDRPTLVLVGHQGP